MCAILKTFNNNTLRTFKAGNGVGFNKPVVPLFWIAGHRRHENEYFIWNDKSILKRTEQSLPTLFAYVKLFGIFFTICFCNAFVLYSFENARHRCNQCQRNAWMSVRFQRHYFFSSSKDKNYIFILPFYSGTEWWKKKKNNLPRVVCNHRQCRFGKLVVNCVIDCT